MRNILTALIVTVTSIQAFGDQAKVSVESQKVAMKAAKAILNINFPKDKAVLKLKSSKAEGDDNHVTETFIINGRGVDSKGDRTSDFYFTIEVLDGAVWSIQSNCPTCS